MHITFLKAHETEYRKYKKDKSYFVNDLEALGYLQDKIARPSGRIVIEEDKKQTATKRKKVEKAGGE